MTIAAKCVAITILLAAMSQALAAPMALDCATAKVTISDHESIRAEQELHFSVDDAAKAIAFSYGTRLRVLRFDSSAISAEHDDMRYEFDRVTGGLTYAGSTTVGNTTVTAVGSGECELAHHKAPN